MALNAELRNVLCQAIKGYDFPFVTYNFAESKEIQHDSMADVEAEVRQQLLGDKPDSIRDGFSNVLYWGYARIGYRWDRIMDFRKRATEQKLLLAGKTVRELSQSGVREIAKVQLPQFSGLSFVSKVRMFLDPVNYVVLDTHLLKLRNREQPSVFDNIVWAKGTSIRITKKNEAVYEQWCNLCRRIAVKEFGNTNFRAVDVERGVFHLIQTDRIDLAEQVILKA